MWSPSRLKPTRTRKSTIQYMSDLHLERINYELSIPSAAASILILAGDIGRFRDSEKYRGFIIKCCGIFEKVLLVGGNHEYYGISHAKGQELIDKIANDPATQGKVLFLNRTTYDVPNSNTTIAGCTLYSHIGPDRSRLMNDFKRIEEWTVDQHNAQHAADLEWLKGTVSSIGTERRIVVATHYAPAFEKTCHPAHEGSKLNQCFASDAFDEVQRCPGAQNVTHWIFGHTHWNAKFRRGKTLLVSNQLCNDSDGLNWRPEAFRYRRFKMTAVLRVE